jgi:1,2-dihydroxy-3-keto-5-methylthiopentene dioxygenase
MAIIRVHGKQEQIQDPSVQVSFLQRYNIGFERWDVSRLQDMPRVEGEGENDHILRVFSPEIKRLMAERGYQKADVVSLSPAMPNLEVILKKFDKEHLHNEDEVRFVVNGRGVFTIHNDADEIVFDVEVYPGDLLVVPDGTWHWFTLCEDKTIQCIRLFQSTEGWTPEYRQVTPVMA